MTQKRDLIVVPIRDNGVISGSIELYISSEQECQLEQQEGVEYWMTIFERFSMALGNAFKTFMIQLVNKLSYSQALIQNELNFELGALAPAQKGLTRDTGFESMNFSKLVYELDLMVRKAFRADSSRVIFLPEKYSTVGVYMQGPWNNRQLIQTELKDSIASEILRNANCSSITMPSSLLCQK